MPVNQKKSSRFHFVEGAKPGVLAGGCFVFFSNGGAATGGITIAREYCLIYGD